MIKYAYPQPLKKDHALNEWGGTFVKNRVAISGSLFPETNWNVEPIIKFFL